MLAGPLPAAGLGVVDYDQSGSVMPIDRRKFTTGTVAITLLAGCEPRSVHSVASLAREVNETSEVILFPDRLAPELQNQIKLLMKTSRAIFNRRRCRLPQQTGPQRLAD
jgi:hypothetical protein